MFGVLLTGALWLRTSCDPAVTALRETVWEVVTRNADYTEAVAVAGRALIGEQDNVLLVFGEKLLGAGRVLGKAMLS